MCTYGNQKGPLISAGVAVSTASASDILTSAAAVVGCTAGAADSNTAGVAADTNAAGAAADNGTAGAATDSVVVVAPAAGGLAPCTAGAAAGTVVDPLTGICTFERRKSL